MTDDESTDDSEPGITLNGEEFSVSAKEKVSTGDYENAEFFQSVSGTIEDADEMDNDGMKAVMAELHRLQNALNSNVRYMGKKRVEEVQNPDEREHNVE